MTKIKALNTDNLVLDMKYYPRIKVNWLTVVDYSESIKAGAKFPPIVVTNWNKKYIVVDGFHRLEAYKKNNIPVIQAEIIKAESEADIFKEAVKRNAIHGRALSPYEKRLILIRGVKEFNLKKIELQDLIFIRAEKFEKFVGNKAKSVFSGKELGEHMEIFKSPTAETINEKDFSSEELNEIKEEEKVLYGMNQISLLKNVLFLLKNNLINKEREDIKEVLKEIQSEIEKYW